MKRFHQGIDIVVGINDGFVNVQLMSVLLLSIRAFRIIIVCEACSWDVFVGCVSRIR